MSTVRRDMAVNYSARVNHVKVLNSVAIGMPGPLKNIRMAYVAISSRTWVMSLLLTVRTYEAGKVITATVVPSSVINSTSNASP